MNAHAGLMPLRRRSSAERRVLAMLRGDDQRPVKSRPAGDPPVALSKSQGLFFAELRRIAGKHEVGVQQPGSPYVSAGELRLLGWMAEVQRIARHSGTMPVEPLFVAAIARCAGLLDGIGLHLAPITLYGARLRSGAPSDPDSLAVARVGAD
jgi:hypothetical protein